MDETGIENARAEDAKIEDPRLGGASANDLEEIDTIIAELDVSKGRGNLILCVVNAPAYRDRIIRVLRKRFSLKVIPVKESEDVIQSLKKEEFGGAEVLIWTMPEKLTEYLADALNNFRELFYDVGVPSLVFLSQSFLDDAIRKAPDFWRYRGNYYELKEQDMGLAFEAIDALSTSLHYQSKEDLLRRKRINKYLLEKVKDEKETSKILDELGQISSSLGKYDEASKYFTQELKLGTTLGDWWIIARSLHNQGNVRYLQSNYKEAGELYQQSLKIKEKLGDESGIAQSLYGLGAVYRELGNYNQSVEFYQQSLKIDEKLGDENSIAQSLHGLGNVHIEQGKYKEAVKLYQHALRIFNDLGNNRDVAIALYQLGMAQHVQGNYKEAVELYQQSLNMFKDLGDKRGVASTFHQLGIVHHDQGNYKEAVELCQQSLNMFKDLGDNGGVAILLAQSAVLEEKMGNPRRALDKIRKAKTMFLEMGNPMAAQARQYEERLETTIANEQS